MQRNRKRIELINRKEFKDFRSLTPNQITTQWKNIKFTSDKKRIEVEQLEYILNTSTNKKIIEDVMKYYNPKAKQYNKANENQKHWYNKAERSSKGIKQLIEINKSKNKAKKEDKKKQELQKVLDMTGIGKFQGTSLYFDYYGTLVLNPAMLGVDIEEKVEEIKAIGMLTKAMQSEIDKKINKLMKEYNIFIEETKKNNLKKVKEIEDKATERVLNFVFEHNDSKTKSGKHLGYFGGIVGFDIEKEKLKALIGRLNASEKAAFENMLLSNEFLQEWCSDQDSTCYDSEFREERLHEAIRIVENHIGEGTEYDPTTDSIRFYKLPGKQPITTSIELSNYI